MAGTATPTATSDSGNVWLEGLLWNSQWSSGGATNVSVYVAGLSGNETVALSGQSITALGSITQGEIDAINCAMDAISDVCNISFTAVGSLADADLIWAAVDNADGQGALGWANPPGTAYNPALSDYQSVVTFNQEAYVTGALDIGSFDYITFIHELGHAVGLAHPHDTGGGSDTFAGVSSAFNDYGNFDMNQGIYTMMSYNDGWHTGPQGAQFPTSYGFQGTPMALDIAALQYMYGATAANTGGDTYTMPSTNATGTFYSCIWDTGGTDTIVGATSLANLIDLRAATLSAEAGGGGFVSYAAGINGGFTIANGVVIENATGGNVDDAMFGNAAANLMDGRGGADIIDGDAGNDTLVGGAGADSLTGGTGNDSISGGDDSDSVIGGAGDDILDGGAAADTFFFEGLFGDDTLSAAADVSAADNVIRFGSLVTESMITYALDQSGAHLLITVAGGSGGTQQAGTILIEGWAAAQASGGGFGSMVWTAGGGGSVDLTAALANPDPDPVPDPEPEPEPDPAPADDPFTGSSGSNTITGTTSGEDINAHGGSDVVFAMGGDDTVDAGFGYDKVDGGEGADSISGAQGNDSLYGDAGNDTIDAGSGNDKAEGGDDNDLIYGGTGRDTLYGGAGNDTIDGGAHNDRLYGGADGDSLIGDAGNDKLMGEAGDDTLNGGTGDDRLVGDIGADVLDGGRGDDYLLGGDGDDFLAGDANEDRLFGEAGNDTLSGGDSADTLDGGAGDDVLDGGRQADVFDFSGAFGNDTISGFDDTAETRQDKLDRIDLTDFRSFNGGLLKMRDLLLTDTGSDVLIEFDFDSNGIADVRDYDGDTVVDAVSILIENSSAASLSAHDFLF